MKRKIPLIQGLCGAAVLALASATPAATVFFDFNGDPSTNGLLNFYGSANWQPSGGCGPGDPSTNGYLQITPAMDSQRGSIVFADFDSGSVVQAFTFEADFRIGNDSHAGGNPADGFSVSYCRANDVVLTVTPPEGWNAGPNCEDNLPEEGSKTGIAIGFDAWNSGGNPPYCNGLNQADPSYIGPDIVGLDIHVDALTIAQFAMPTLNGACNDATSLQTGPQDPTNPGVSPTNLCWAHLKVVLTTNAQLSIFWKGTQLLSNYQTSYFPSPGRLVFAGRTGNANEFHEVDNIAITTVPASLALVGAATGYPDGFNVQVNDSGSSVINTNIAPSPFTLNGSPKTPTSITKVGGATTYTYRGFPTLLPSGSTNTVVISCKDGNGNTISGTRTFVVPPYTTLSIAGLAGGVDTTKPGFRLLPWQSGAEPNAVYWMLEQLEGLHGANNADLTTATDNGYIDYTNGYTASLTGVGTWTWTRGTINFDLIAGPWAAGGGGDGDFQTANGYGDDPCPGIPGVNGITDNTSFDAVFYLNFPSPGLYNLGVNSDDGFAVMSGLPNPRDRFAQVLGQFNGGRGASDTIFTVAVTNAGIYRMRLAWENGGGGANCEFFTQKADGTKVLINDPDPTNTTAITAYYVGPAFPAYVSQIKPYIGQPDARPDVLYAQLTDTSLTTVVPAGVFRMLLDGVPRTLVKSKTGSVTTVVGLNYPSDPLMTPGLHTATLEWTDSASTMSTDNWSFTVVSVPNTLSTNLWTAPGTGSAPGFRLQAFKSPNTNLFNGWDNWTIVMDAALNGTYGVNGADTSWQTNNGAYIVGTGGEPAVINFSQNSTAAVTQNGNFQSGGGHPDNGVPGLNPPLFGWAGMGGNAGAAEMDNDAYMATTFVEFPTAGFYQMGVNSDDGFKVSYGDRTAPGRSICEVLQPLSVHGEYIGINTATNSGAGNAGFGATLPTTPLIAQAVVCNPVDACSPLVNASAIAGKIAVCQRGGSLCNFAAQSLNCYNAGAIAVVEGLDSGSANQLPSGRGGSGNIPIPCIEITYPDSVSLIAAGTTDASSPLYIRISGDTAQKLGEFSGGRGSTDTTFNFIVPRAGIYPLKLSWENGGGDANSEWFTVDSNGNKLLINDASSPVKAWTVRTIANPAPTVHAVLVGTTLTLSWSGEGELEYCYNLGDPNPPVVPNEGGAILSRWRTAANQNNPQTVNVATPGVPSTLYRIRSY